jgi:hypothetical protein
MSRELWATYSVKDHLRPRELAVDVMLFDRLVFPVPEEGHFPENSDPTKRGPVEWKRNAAEWSRWEEKKWDPDAQSRVLELLNPVIRKVGWSSKGKMDEDYQAEAAKLAAMGVPDYAFKATRTLLTRDLPAYVDSVPAIGPVYRTFDEFMSERGDPKRGIGGPLPGQMLANVLASEFFVPDISEQKLSDEELLRETVEFVVGNAEFRTRRAAFVDWQQEFLRNGVTDRESIARAVRKMHDLLNETNEAAKQLTIRRVTRRVFQLAPAVLGLAAAVLRHETMFAAGGIFLSLGDIVVDEKLFKASEQAQAPAAAFVHDARRHFGWNDQG